MLASSPQLVQHYIEHPALGGFRSVWLQTPVSGTPRCLCLFLDGDLYINPVRTPERLASLQEEGRLPPLYCAYLAFGDPARRHTEFTCNETFTDFLTSFLLPWLREMAGGGEIPTLICGLSLSGLAAAYAAIRHPETFTAGALCQSPSAWWNDEWLASQPGINQQGTRRLWISVGKGETASGVSHPPTGLFQGTSQLDSCRRLSSRLRNTGWTVGYSEFDGGHDPACWALDLPAGLSFLLEAVQN